MNALVGDFQAGEAPSLLQLRPAGGFRLVVADPPWPFETRSKKGQTRSAEAHYQTMSLKDIAAIRLKDVCADNCILVMWATFPLLREQIGVLEALGFTYKSGGAWAKTTKDGTRLRYGMGYVTRGCAELYLVGYLGKPRLMQPLLGALMAPRREHSRKPDEFYAMVEEVHAGPRLDLFARQHRPGWTAWGNEAGKFDGGAA